MKLIRNRSITMGQVRKAGLALALLALAASARGQVASVYMTVDAVSLDGSTIKVTGVVQGEATPSSHSIQFNLGTAADQIAAREACGRLLLLALSKPGQYLAEAALNRCSVALVKP